MLDAAENEHVGSKLVDCIIKNPGGGPYLHAQALCGHMHMLRTEEKSPF